MPDILDTKPKRGDGPADAAEIRDDFAKLQQYKAWFRADREHSAKWRRRANENFDFAALDQWSEEDKSQLKAQLRPIIVFDQTNSILNSVSGMEINNRQEVKYFPREPGDAAPDEVLTSGAEWFRDQASADDEDSDMFLDSLICGLGGTETTLSFEDNEDGDPVVSKVSPLELYWDHSARKKNFTDASRKWRVRQIPLSKARELAESLGVDTVSAYDLDANWAALDQDDDGEPTDRERARLYADQGTEALDRDETMVTIVHLQHITRETRYDVTDPTTGQTASDLTQEDYLKLNERAKTAGLRLVVNKKKAKVIRTCIIGGKIILDKPALCPKDFSFNFVTAYLDKNGLPFGLMRIMEDPQRWSNKWLSQALHILNTNAKGGWFVEEDAMEDIRDFERTVARNDKATILASGAIASKKILAKSQASMDGAFFNMMQFASSSVRTSTGVSLEMLGLREATQANSLEAQRRQAGAMGLQPLFDNLKRYRRDQGKCMLYIIQKVIPKIDQMSGQPPRLVRIVGDDGSKYVPLALKADARYDIIVDDQPVSPDRNMDVLKILSPYMGSFPPQVMLALLDLLPIPTSVKEKIRAASQQAMQQASQRPDPKVQVAQIQADTTLKGKMIEAQSKPGNSPEQIQSDYKTKILTAVISAIAGIEEAQIRAGVDTDSDIREQQLAAVAGLGDLINQNIMQQRDHQNQQTMQQADLANQQIMQQNEPQPAPAAN